MCAKKLVALLLALSSSLMFAEVDVDVRDPDALSSVNPGEGCYDAIRNYLLYEDMLQEKKDRDIPVIGGGVIDSGIGDGDDRDLQEPSMPGDDDLIAPEEDRFLDELGAGDQSTEPEMVSEPALDVQETAPEGLLGLDDTGASTGPAPVIIPDSISPTEEALTDALLENADVQMALENAEDDDDLGEILGGVLGGLGAAGLLGALLYKLKKKGLLPSFKKLPIQDEVGKEEKVQTGEIKRALDENRSKINQVLQELEKFRLDDGQNILQNDVKNNAPAPRINPVLVTLTSLDTSATDDAQQLLDQNAVSGDTPPPLLLRPASDLIPETKPPLTNLGSSTQPSAPESSMSELQRKLAERKKMVDAGQVTPDMQTLLNKDDQKYTARPGTTTAASTASTNKLNIQKGPGLPATEQKMSLADQLKMIKDNLNKTPQGDALYGRPAGTTSALSTTPVVGSGSTLTDLDKNKLYQKQRQQNVLNAAPKKPARAPVAQRLSTLKR